MSGDPQPAVPEIAVHVDGLITEEDVKRHSDRIRAALRLAQPDPRRHVLIKHWHDQGGIEAAYGPYTQERAGWMRQHFASDSYSAWTVTELQAEPED